MLLIALLFIPFVGGVLCWQYELWRPGTQAPRWVALLSMLAILGICVFLWLTGTYDVALPIGHAPTWTNEIQLPWIPRLGISFHLALDGMSLILISLTAFLGVLAVLCSWREIEFRIGFFHLNLLWIIGGVVGVFLSIDLFLFYFFWEMMLVPMYFLISLWGHSSGRKNTRVGAATKFFIYTQISGMLILLASLGLVFAHYSQTGVLTFNYMVLEHTTLSTPFAYVLMLGFFIAFAVKLPTVPLHGWLPDAHAQAPTAGSVDLAGILLKTAAYGMMRFALPLFPHASVSFAPIAMVLGLIGIYYGALMAFSQYDMKRLIACSSISHMGFILIGIYSGSTLALQGVIMLMVAHAFSSAGLFIISGQIYERVQTRDMRKLGGLFGRMGSLPGFAMAFTMASLGLPGTANFVGEIMVLFGTFSTAPVVVVIATGGLILAAIYSLVYMHRVYFGKAADDDGAATGEATTSPLVPREYIMLAGLLILTIAAGLYPQFVLDVSSRSMHEVQHWFAAALPTLMLP